VQDVPKPIVKDVAKPIVDKPIVQDVPKPIVKDVAKPIVDKPKPIVHDPDPLIALQKAHDVRVNFVKKCVSTALQELTNKYGKGAEFPNEDIKKVVMTILQKDPNIHQILVHSKKELKLIDHESRLYMRVVEQMLSTKGLNLPPITMKIMCHVGTSVNVLNSGSAVGISPDKIMGAKPLYDNYYNEIFKEHMKIYINMLKSEKR